MSDGQQSSQQYLTDGLFKKVLISPPDAIVSKVVLNADSSDSELYGI